MRDEVLVPEAGHPRFAPHNFTSTSHFTPVTHFEPVSRSFELDRPCDWTSVLKLDTPLGSAPVPGSYA